MSELKHYDIKDIEAIDDERTKDAKPGHVTNCTRVYIKSEADKVIADKDAEIRRLKRDLWVMTAEWAKGMGLAACNIAIKLSFKERFFYHDEANREKDIKKYRHRQVVFCKYADYCQAKAEEYK